MSEKYSADSSLLIDIDGVPHFESEQDGVLAYRPCPPELVSLILANQQAPSVKEETIPDNTHQERRRRSPKLIRGAAKVAIIGAILGGVDIGASFTTTQVLSGNTRGDVGKAVDDLWTDVTLPLRMAVGE